ncbi:IclR family transcriptional regulator [Pseudomonas juntendi]|nr:IclR family transcriptional regulator [Pseudomonas juntendi]MBR7520620.1 IclR family transcriptional regulator [Pseudomonas juntendi]PYB96531.1 IclR family transcriptional regulator [Pseudomonas sp. MB-090624]WDM57870.1 IclR family transcriptional regulator [Pseudomonas sp. NEEL19]
MRGERLNQDDEKPASGPALLESVEMVFRLLDELTAARRPLGVTELAQQLQTAKPRTYRHLASMRQLGILEQDPATEKYLLGARLVAYGEAASEQFDLRAIADPYLTRIRDATGQTALLAVATHDTALVVSCVESKANVCISVKPGNRVLPYCSAQGRTVLAFADAASQQRVMRRKMPQLTELTLHEPDALAARLALIRERLYDDADGEVTLGINALCCPIFRDNDQIVGTIGIVGPSAAIPSPPPAAMLRELQSAAAEISERLHAGTYQRL